MVSRKYSKLVTIVNAQTPNYDTKSKKHKIMLVGNVLNRKQLSFSNIFDNLLMNLRYTQCF